MKSYRSTIRHISIFCLSGLMIPASLQAQEIKDTTGPYLRKLVASNDPGDKKILNDRLSALAKSDKEQDLITAEGIYYQLKNNRVVDSLQKEQLVKFPDGIAARDKAMQVIFNEKEPQEKEQRYKRWISKFPPSRFPDIDHDHIVYDYVRSDIAQLYAMQKNVAKAEQYAGLLEEEFWKGNGYAGLAAVFQKNGDLDHAETYAKKAMEASKEFLNATDNAGKFAASGYPGLCNTYVSILYTEGKYDKALQYMDTLYRLNTTVNPETNYTYAKLLMHFNKNKDAYEKMDAVMKTGKATEQMDSVFKVLYAKVNGNLNGYPEYLAGIHNIVQDNLKKDLEKSIMNKPAPLFTLTDVDGNKVSLEQFRGKTVVLDFWATWCGPCKRSFPAMQMAKNKYKDDPDVKFLFIHTWERDTDATAEAKKYVRDNHYDFEVLMDLKDSASKENKVVSSYGVTGIPAKFVIDPKGNIRFQLTGFDGSNEQAVNEISMMIEAARKSD